MKLFIVALLSGLIMSNEALAANGQGYVAATSCVSSGGTPSINSGRLYNTSTTDAMTVNCGFMIEVTTSKFDFSKTQVWVHDQTNAGSIACTQFSRKQSSSTVTTSSAVLAYPSAAGSPSAYSSSTPTSLSLSSGGTGQSFSSSAPVWNYVLCTIPASSSSSSNLTGILSIYAEEL